MGTSPPVSILHSLFCRITSQSLRPADDRADGDGLSEGEVSDGGASVASSVSKLARQARNGFDIR